MLADILMVGVAGKGDDEPGLGAGGLPPTRLRRRRRRRRAKGGGSAEALFGRGFSRAHDGWVLGLGLGFGCGFVEIRRRRGFVFVPSFEGRGAFLNQDVNGNRKGKRDRGRIR